MRRVSVAFGVLTGISLVLTGCSLLPGEQREAWRMDAERACLARGDVTPSAYASRMSPISGPGSCGITRPFKVTALGGGEVQLSNPATLGCPVIAETERWLAEIVQPAAMLYFGSRVSRIRSGDYACRTRNSRPGARMSEHAFGNAVDVMSFTLADERTVTVLDGWRGDQAERGFLREVFVGACRYFTTVLGPGSDAFHYDHFHLDLARHGRNGDIHVCRPDIDFTPRIDPDAPPMMSVWPRKGADPVPAARQPLAPSRPDQAQMPRAADLPREPQEWSRPAPQPDPFPVTPALEPRSAPRFGPIY